MSIVLNENEWAAEMIRTCSLGQKRTETLRRVARYYLDAGYNKAQAQKKVEEFYLRCDPEVAINDCYNMADLAMKQAIKTPAISIDYINIYPSELEWIEELGGKMVKRLAFTLLCLARLQMTINPKSNYWVKDTGNEIMQLAKNNTSIKQQGKLYSILKDCNMIQYSKRVDNTNVRILFADRNVDCEPVMCISDFRNLGNQYMMYIGEPYFVCENCGIVTKINDPKNRRRQIYCKDCAVKVHIKQKVDSAMRIKQPV